MSSSICTSLLRKTWRAYELDKIPHLEGIYVIGYTCSFQQPEVVYVGRSNDIHRRMVEHKRQKLAVDEFVQQQFADNGGKNLQVKWIKENNPAAKESQYIKCFAGKLGYWPQYNIRRWTQRKYK